MQKLQSDDAVADVASVTMPKPEAVRYVDMVCPHDGKVYPCYAWTVKALEDQGWKVPEK